MFTLPHRYADKNGSFPIVRLSDKVARVWVDEVGVEFTLRHAKVAVLVGLPPVVAPQGRAARVVDPVDLPLVGLQGAALREGLFAELTPVGPDTCHRRRSEREWDAVHGVPVDCVVQGGSALPL